MTTTPTQPTGHEEAVEVIARTAYERYDSHFSMPGGMTWEQYVADDPSGADAMYRADARDTVAALTSAGLLATEQEWGVRHSQGIRREPSQRSASEWSEQTNARNADRFDYERRLKTTVVSRRVTAWTEVDA